MAEFAIQGAGLSDFADRTDLSKPKDIAEAAEQFEALLLNQLLRSASDPDSGGWFGTGEADQAGMQALQLAQQQFAELLAARGGFGLARLITERMAESPETAPAAPNRDQTLQRTGPNT